MKKHIRLGVVCLARNTFDYKAAEGFYRRLLEDLRGLENVTVVAVEPLIMEIPDAVAAARRLYDGSTDAVAVVSGTFHLGHLLLEIKKRADKPLLLWALPEPPYNGGKIALNSLCGVNLDASNLIKSGISDFSYSVGTAIDEDWLDAVRIKTALAGSRIGLLGSHAHGFFNLDVDELALYRKFGVFVDHFCLEQLRNYPSCGDSTARYAEIIKSVFDLSNITQRQAALTAELCAKLEAFCADKELSALAIRCWPEFAAGYGVAPCAAMSVLQSHGAVLACEGDIDCALTMLCHKAAGAETPYMADLSQADFDKDTALMWHCGVAPYTLCAAGCAPSLDTYFAAGKGVTAGFVLKTGKINIARLDSINGNYRLFQQKGEALPMEKRLLGTYAKARFEIPMRQVLDKVVYNGIAHHVSMAYGDYTNAMSIFARLCGIETVP